MDLASCAFDGGSCRHEGLRGDLAAVGPQGGTRVAQPGEDVAVNLGQVEAAEERIALLGAHGSILSIDPGSAADIPGQGAESSGISPAGCGRVCDDSRIHS